MFGRGSMKPHPTPAHLSALMNQAREYLPATATSGLARSVIRNVSQATPFKALSLSINAEQSVSAPSVPTVSVHAAERSTEPTGSKAPAGSASRPVQTRSVTLLRRIQRFIAHGLLSWVIGK